MTATVAPRSRPLLAVKLGHTIVWAVFAGCIIVIPVAAWSARLDVALWLIGIVFVEVVILAFHGWRCPLTDVAARYTADRRANFDIYLPLWLAKHNKRIFGVLFVLGILATLTRWWQRG